MSHIFLFEKSTHVIPTTTTDEREDVERRYGKRRDGERTNDERTDGERWDDERTDSV